MKLLNWFSKDEESELIVCLYNPEVIDLGELQKAMGCLPLLFITSKKGNLEFISTGFLVKKKDKGGDNNT